jgi:hypothetical protein
LMKRIQVIEKMADSYLNREIDAGSHYMILELRITTSDDMLRKTYSGSGTYP